MPFKRVMTLTKRDKILIMVLALIALVSFAIIHFAGNVNRVTAAEISADGKLVHRIELHNLTQLKEFTVQGPLGPTVIQVRQGEARILHSPCPDKICVRMGWIKMPGQSAICIPNRILLHIVSEENQVDSISR